MDEFYFKSNRQGPNKIIEGLYLSGFYEARQKDILNKLGITHILVAGNNLSKEYPEDFIYRQYKIDDDCRQSIQHLFDDSYEYLITKTSFIKEGILKGGILVHCAAGVSRSASLVIAYLMRENNWKYDESYKFVKSKRSIISPNTGFYNQLRCYEIKLGLIREDEIDELTRIVKYQEKVSFSYDDF